MKEKDPNDVDEELMGRIQDWLDDGKDGKNEISEPDVPKQRRLCYNCLRRHLTSNLRCPFCGTNYKT